MNKLSAKNIGILDIQVYFPRYYVDQNELEVADKVDKGKYTIGLGQQKMAFVGDREDINTICLTVLERLLQRNKIDPKKVGRLEVGTETFLDKSKSIKTYLMDFFKDSQNYDIEGITTSNACYGGTNALFNTINWMQSEFYDGRYAIVITADIAVYAKGKARPTGGCGATAMLIGPNAPIVFENVRSTYVNNVYDFYKPNPSSEYPEVDGIFSIDCYFKALESCYETFLQKYQTLHNQNVNLNFFDYFCFHSPFSKMVEKAFLQVVSYDLHSNNKTINNTGIASSNSYYNLDDPKVKELVNVFATREKNFKLDNKLQNSLKAAFGKVYKDRVDPSLMFGRNLGNIYTGSLYIGLYSILLNKNLDLTNKRIFMFSYGSGCSASLFSLKVVSPDYRYIQNTNADAFDNLNNRIKKTPEEYEKILTRKEKLYLSNNYESTDNIDELFNGTYYLEKVDERWRRYYTRKGLDGRKITFNKLSHTDELSPKNLGKGESRINMIRSQLVSTSNKNENVVGLPKFVTVQENIWAGFHKKSIHERHLQIKKVYPNIDTNNLQTGGLNLIRAENMIENCIGIISIPVGLGLNFTVNSKKYNVPMAIEEPSVIAAVSNSAKLISENNGFFCYSDPPLMITQIHIVDTDSSQTVSIINENKSKLINIGNSYCQDMVQRGGGIIEIYTRVLKPSTPGNFDGKVVLEAIVNVCDSMGANTLNTISEAISLHLETMITGIILLKILTNLAIYRKSTAEFKIKIENLGYKGLSGEEIAKRVVDAWEIASLDPYRCSTHNKGIMNGIDAVALALGQDWRAIEAASHAYATLNPKTLLSDGYKSLTYYKIVDIKGEKYLYGNLTLPIAVGTVGGAINSNENYRNMMKFLGNVSSQQLSQIIVSVGLAQNFAALRALVSEGIQKGHMGLHARNIAISAGVPDHLIPDVVNFMKNNKTINSVVAKNFMESLEIYTELRNKNNSNKDSEVEVKQLSSFYIEIDYSFLKEPIVMNFLLKCNIYPPIHFSLRSRKINNEDNRINEIFKILFGEDKHEDWLHEFLKFVNQFDWNSTILTELSNIKYKLKIIVLLLYTISYNLLKYNFEDTKLFLEKILSNTYNYDKMLEFIPNSSLSINFGLSVILELFEIMKFYINNYVKTNKIVAEKLLFVIENSLKAYINMVEFGNKIKTKQITLNKEIFDSFLEQRFKRLNATIIILISLAFSDEQISEEVLNYFLSFGRYCEVKLTLFRDYKRYKVH
jgi:hydroxymethylglutaryl-CoA synthase